MNRRRFFYTDPLAVAWMAKHYGMRFYDFATGVVANRYDGGLHDTCCIDVHPDSFHLLEPQKGDIVTYPFDGREGVFRCLELPVDPRPLPVGHKIIHRNGMAFMWPESEAA